MYCILYLLYNLLNLSNFKVSLWEVKHGLIRLTSELADLQTEEQNFFVSFKFYTYNKIWRQMRTSNVVPTRVFVITEIWRQINLKLCIWLYFMLYLTFVDSIYRKSRKKVVSLILLSKFDQYFIASFTVFLRQSIRPLFL